MLGVALERFCAALRGLLAVLVGALAAPVAMQVIARYTGLIPNYLWTEELATFLFIWVVMIGSMVAVWDGTHFDVRVLPDARGPLASLLQDGFVLVCVLAFGLMVAWYGVDYARFGANQRSMMMGANKIFTHVSVPIAGAVWAIFAAWRLKERIDAWRRSQPRSAVR
ncbi:TRAP transporter small permease [Oceanicella actignis]|uniref:TRAP transporter small permease protein n=1 Tax=Oceanicella actignis TaxID=1189325 RepID=A0A1M7RZN7_9RHOB|nr:TRAP transporter small permease subunit [Oceanicella actignis]TYO90059.1 TRAP-type C4-dicarboxylate transport system permease small subunit [Oceanicella actignis]SES94656.1 TRAP-type C4-dicarboxylate transport system, small permease component [Oceanicella actignis]SHN51648.1 TRAP-type C4-dicarboxylate transport system, small permease component [Oceanicella actignis]